MSGYLRLLDWAPGIQALSVDGNVDIASECSTIQCCTMSFWMVEC